MSVTVRCSFAHSCVFGGLLRRVPGTLNRYFCEPHFRNLQIATRGETETKAASGVPMKGESRPARLSEWRIMER
jgi:hypothetical protein